MTFRSLDGGTQRRSVVTNRGEAKAVYLASGSAKWNLFRRFHALDVEVHDDGPPELDGNGVPILQGYAFDRDEW